MKVKIAAVAGLLLLAAAAAQSAENEARTYGNAACSDRNAKPGDCVIQDGPPRRRGQVDTTQDQGKPGPRESKSGDNSQGGRK